MSEFFRTAAENHIFPFLFIGGVLLVFVLAFVPKPAPRPPPPPGMAVIHSLPPDPAHMQVLVSLVLLAAGLYVILSKQYDAQDKHWAYGTVGTLVGFWLRPHRAKSKAKAGKKPENSN